MRLNESRTRSFQAPVTIHNYPGRQVYVFPNGHSDSEESEEELNVMELRPRGKEQQRCSTSQDRAGDVVLLEREITEDDNLNKLALQYGCKVADIKRVNNFIREQDLYALKSIKIPVKPHGLLTENGRELKPLPTAPSQTGLTVLDLPEPDDGVSSSADGRHLSDYFRGIDKSIQDAVQAEVQLNTEYCMEALERLPPELGKQETSNGRLRCRAAERFPWKAERLAARPPDTRRSRSWEHLSLQGLFSGERCFGAPQYAWGQRRFRVAGFKVQSCGL